ncbi:translation initiation factor 2 [Streptomyces sp. B1866]|uniref:translation initiation factor 2 n=1 Tax=Streptomyces sp. B1866 TaxID=3075431 RepID=UPI002891E166|nr:translation initiation factor 2 [Streptomyces sp. B1866]MDT3399124.1 translation initiation factor 2 [Streptomyces sp. B1866]
MDSSGDGRRATGDGRRAVLFAARSANALHRLLDVLPVFAGDERVSRLFTLVPGSDFGVEALAAVERARAHTIPWAEACQGSYDLVIAASPKGELWSLRGPRVLLPHGAGFGKSLPGEGAHDSASGLDPAFLVRDGETLASFHALSHPSQLTRLAAASPRAAARAGVVGDPALERILASVGRREEYRRALGTGARTLVVLVSTWGPECLLRRRPGLPAELAARLPYDAYQLGLILHPNERAHIGHLDLAEQLAPALDAGLVLAGPYEEWCALLIAADAVVTDHGSAALYAAALDRPVVAAYDGGAELIPGSPMARLLARGPRLDAPGGLEAALGAHRPGATRAVAAAAFAEQGRALERLQEELYGLLGLTPRSPARARILPSPPPPDRTPAAFAVRAETDGDEVRVERFPAHTGTPGHHLAAEHGTATERHALSAGLLYRRARPPLAAPHGAAWTAGAWTEHVLARYPGCRAAAAVLEDGRCLVRTRSGDLLAVRLGPAQDGGLVVTADPAAVLSAVHARLAARSGAPGSVRCLVGGRAFTVRLSPATAADTECLL